MNQHHNLLLNIYFPKWSSYREIYFVVLMNQLPLASFHHCHHQQFHRIILSVRQWKRRLMTFIWINWHWTLNSLYFFRTGVCNMRNPLWWKQSYASGAKNPVNALPLHSAPYVIHSSEISYINAVGFNVVFSLIVWGIHNGELKTLQTYI